MKTRKRKARGLKNLEEVEKLQDANKRKLSQTTLDSFSGEEVKKGRTLQDQNSTELAEAVVQSCHTP